jgi:hypothetical protein
MATKGNIQSLGLTGVNTPTVAAAKIYGCLRGNENEPGESGIDFQML